MKLKLKLNNSELLALVSLLDVTCQQYQQEFETGTMEMEDKLIKAVFEEMYVKLLKKQLEVQKQYTIDLKPSWAIALHIQYSGLLNRASYEGNLVQGICDKIHQHHC